MKVSVKPLIGQETEKTIPFSGGVDLSHITYWGVQPFVEDVQVTGTIENLKYGVFQVTYQVQGGHTIPCARCNKEVTRTDSQEFTHQLREVDEASSTEDLYIPLADGILDVSQMVSTDLLLTLDDNTLCVPDCKGLCPVCGSDRNQTECNCTVKVPDPRFDVLRKLLDKSSN